MVQEFGTDLMREPLIHTFESSNGFATMLRSGVVIYIDTTPAATGTLPICKIVECRAVGSTQEIFKKSAQSPNTSDTADTPKTLCR
jgi:hypothetical protein